MQTILEDQREPLLMKEMEPGLGLPSGGDLFSTDIPVVHGIPDLDFADDYVFRMTGTSISYLDVKDKYIKMHKKLTAAQIQAGMAIADSWMRVVDGSIKIKVENRNLGGETIVKVFVKRTDECLEKALTMSGGQQQRVRSQVPLTVNPQDITCVNSFEWEIKVDLDSVHSHEEDGVTKEVYSLCSASIEKTNKFQLSTEVYIRQGYTETLIAQRLSPPFLLRTEPRKQKGKYFGSPPISPSTGSEPSPGSGDTGFGESPSKKPKPNGPILPDGCFNKVTANEATIKTLICQTRTTSKRDIAYHVKLHDPSQYGKFKEGDVVVFLKTDDDDSAIELLNSENRGKATLAGVISRSYFLEGAFPRADETPNTDLVCINGVVNVNTIGPVNNGDQLYAHPERPGVAISYSNLQLFRRDTAAKPLFLGQALETKSDVALNEQVLVSSFVSVFLGIDSIATAKTVSDAEVKMKENFNTIVRDASKRFKCRVILLKILLLAIIGIIALAIWQRYAPNTLFRRSFCKQGCNGARMKLSFSTSWQRIYVDWLGFEYKNLESKLYKKIKPCPGKKCGNETIQYFMNFDRCSNRGVRFGNEFLDDTPTVSGPEIIAIDHKCSLQSMHYYVDNHWVSFNRRHRKSMPSVRCFQK